MAQVYDNWERLVRATLRREHFRLSALRSFSELSVTPSTLDELSLSSSSFNFSDSSHRLSTFKLPSSVGGEAFDYDQILRASNYFSNFSLIRHGRSGDLFSGVLDGGIPVVIKRIYISPAKESFCMSELKAFGKTSHRRLVPFIGHCLDNSKQKFLVYKYMPNGDLSSSFYREPDPLDHEQSVRSLDWITRWKIAIGAAEGLCYLHDKCSPPLVHRDVQASSILLDDNFEVRLGSLSEVCAQKNDNHQNIIARLLRLPQTSEQGVFSTSNATCAYDVYCFGKVLLELVTGKLGISASSEVAMKDWLKQTLPYISLYDKELVTNIVDPSLIIGEDLLEEVWAMAIVARSCLNPKPSRRPLMRYILTALVYPLKVVRQEDTISTSLRATSSSSSWNAFLFESWWHSSSDVVAAPAAPTNRAEGASSFKQSGTTGSQGSSQNGEGTHSSSTRRHSKEILLDPLDEQDVKKTKRELEQRW